jgi:hypothetical protein
VLEINRLGWRAATHAVGDAAVDEVLTGYELANKDKSLIGKRWTIEHAFVVRPDLVKRMQDLKLMISAQNHLYLAAPVLKRYWGADLASEVTPLRTYQRPERTKYLGTSRQVGTIRFLREGVQKSRQGTYPHPNGPSRYHVYRPNVCDPN